MDETETRHRSGVVAMVGPTNAGKSTLLNRLLGQKIAIVTPKAQTTRNRILGVVTEPGYQILFLDTPGFHESTRQLNQGMIRVAVDSLAEADVVLYLVDGSEDLSVRTRERQVASLRHLENVRCPTILAINKVDLVDKHSLLPRMEWFAASHRFEAIVPISALSGEGTGILVDELVRRLPAGPRYYPDDVPTDATERFIVAEIIREKIFLLTRQEVPYGTAVIIEDFKEGDPVHIHAAILVEQDSQKGIILGRQGKMIKEIGTRARIDIERLLDCRVVLKLWVKVRKNWTKNERILRELGY